MALTAKQRCLRGISGVLCAGPHQVRPACGPFSCSPPDTSPSRSRKEGGPAERQGTAQLGEHALLLGGRGTPRGWLWWPGVASSLQGRGAVYTCSPRCPAIPGDSCTERWNLQMLSLLIAFPPKTQQLINRNQQFDWTPVDSKSFLCCIHRS